MAEAEGDDAGEGHQGGQSQQRHGEALKPFSLRELLARLRAVLRRQEMERVARTRDPEEADIDSRAGNSNGVAEDCSIPMRRRSR
jgi:hypothetical protein